MNQGGDTSLPANPLEAVELFRRVRDFLVASGHQDAPAFLTMLAHFEAARGTESADHAFRFTPTCGGANWPTLERRARRDRRLIEAWRTHYPKHSATGAAAALAKDIVRAGQLKATSDARLKMLAEIYELNGGGTIGKRQILTILQRDNVECAMKGAISLRRFSLRNEVRQLGSHAVPNRHQRHS